MCLGLLWLRPRPVVAAFPPSLAVLSTLARATWWGYFADLAGVWAWLRIRCLPSRASQARCGFGPGSLPGRRSGRRELTRAAHYGGPAIAAAVAFKATLHLHHGVPNRHAALSRPPGVDPMASR